jgi:hypothetical protein
VFTGGTYSAGGANTSSVAPQTPFGTCAVNCHAGSVPAWTGAGVGCDLCHPYLPAQWNNLGSYPYQSATGAEAWGVHAKHITNVAAAKGVTLDAMTDGYSGNVVCGACHNMSDTHHDSTRSIQMTSYTFGETTAIYNGTVGVSSATAPKTCSNVSCHYLTTPVWGAY